MAGGLVGIDLGTTLSVIAHLDQTGTATCIPNAQGDLLTPSAIYIDGEDVVVGKAARDAAAHFPDKVATLIKRDIGRRHFSRVVDGRTFRPETLSAILLKKLKQDAERRIGPIAKAVITVPAFFDDVRRKATEVAGRIAGLEVLDIINEPTAAALAYSLEAQLSRGGHHDPLDFPGGKLTVVVYDLGGGTFDVSVVRLAAKRFETLASDGDAQLGGKDWDDRIVKFLGQQFHEQFGINPADSPDRQLALADLAEAAKKLLSQLPSAPVEFHHADKSLKTTLTRQQFQEMTSSLLTRTEFVTNIIVEDQLGISWDEIDRVLMVGGSTRMPMIKEMLARITGKTPDDSLDPDQVVARGAAIFANILAIRGQEGDLVADDEVEAELKDVVVQDVTAHSLGIKARSKSTGRFVNTILIPKNTQLPYSASKVFRIHQPGATSVRVEVLEGELEDAADNMLVGECLISGLPKHLPAKSPVQVRLSFESNGRVSVMALDMTGGKFAEAAIKNQAGLSEEEIRREIEFVERLKIQ